jgi:hypothetical protein
MRRGSYRFLMVAWMLSWTLALGIWLAATGHWIIGAVLLAGTGYWLMRRYVVPILGRRSANRSANPS